MSKPSVCLIMICKDNENTIRRALESVKGQIDYWVVSDTGSSDKTPEIVLEVLDDIPGILIEEPFRDFSYNLNTVIEDAEKHADWLLRIDSDFEMVGDLPDLSAKKEDVLGIKTHSGTVHYLPFLFRSQREIRYRGKVHEWLYSPRGYTSGVAQGVEFINYPFENKDSFRRMERNLRLLLDDEPDPRRSFYLGESYRGLNMEREAIRWYQDAVATTSNPDEWWYGMYQSSRLAKDPTGLMRAYIFRPSCVEPLYALQELYRLEDRLVDAFLVGKLAETLVEPDTFFFNESWMYKYGVNFELSITLARLGYYDLAEQYNQKVLACNPPKDIVRAIEHNRTFYPVK